MTPNHFCNEDSVSKAIFHHIWVNGVVWNNLPWSCLTCCHVNTGTDTTCSKAGCEDRGSWRTYVQESLLTGMEQETMESNPQLWSIHLVMEVLLSPHNRVNEGMLEVAFNTVMGRDAHTSPPSTSPLSGTSSAPSSPSHSCINSTKQASAGTHGQNGHG